MNVKPIRWLYDELPGLVREGILDEGTAARLRGHYGPVPDTMSGRNILFIVFGALGAVLIGGGISLLLSHNWENLGRPTRAALSFALLLAAQAITGWTIWKRRGSRAWTEGAALFLSLAVVSVITLIGQTYHIPGDPQALLLTWVVLILPLVYLLSSRAAAALVWIGSTWWLLGGFWWDVSLVRPGLYALLVGSTVPFLAQVWKRHRNEASTSLLGWAIAGSLLLAGIRLLNQLGGDLWIPFYAGAFGSLYVLGLRMGDRVPESASGWRNPFHSLGAIGLAVLFFAIGFIEVWREDWAFDAGGIGNLVIMMVFALGLCSFSTLSAVRLLRESRIHQGALALLPAAAVAGWLLEYLPDGPAYTTILVNLAALGAGLTVCISGARQGRLGTANGGLILVMAILAARFFDADLSFVTRGVGFILLGAGLLGVNVLILRRRKGGES